MKQRQNGIDRLNYIMLSLALIAVSVMVSFLPFGVLIILPLSIVFIFILAARIKNVGWNPWLALFNFVPFANLIIMWAAFALPPGFAVSKKFDTAAKILTTIMAVMTITMPILIIIAVSMVGSSLESTFKKVEQNLQKHEMEYQPSAVRQPTQFFPSPNEYLTNQRK